MQSVLWYFFYQVGLLLLLFAILFASIANNPAVYFTVPHSACYPTFRIHFHSFRFRSLLSALVESDVRDIRNSSSCVCYFWCLWRHSLLIPHFTNDHLPQFFTPVMYLFYNGEVWTLNTAVTRPVRRQTVTVNSVNVVQCRKCYNTLFSNKKSRLIYNGFQWE